MLLDAFLHMHRPKIEEDKEAKKDKRFQPRINTKAGALAVKFAFTGEIVEYRVPATRSYRIQARSSPSQSPLSLLSFLLLLPHSLSQVKGAKAADGASKKGGRGAVIEAVFQLRRNDVLFILVGGLSEKRDDDSGGGGGTFVAINARDKPLIVAGGGGGTRGHDEDVDGLDASLTEDGKNGAGKDTGKGGKGGQGGKQAGTDYGGGGGGFFGDGDGNDDNDNAYGRSFVNGGEGRNGGGFGGGGGCGRSGGGGGGGYSGGGGGRGGGGGGSFVRSDGIDVKKEVQNEAEGECSIFYA